MDRSFLKASILRIDEHIRTGELHVVQQRRIVTGLIQLDLEHAQSLALLKTFELLVDQHKAHRETLLGTPDGA